MKKYKNGDEFRSDLGDEKVIAAFYMSACPFCKKFCPKFEDKFDNKSGYAMVAIDNYNDKAWDDFDINIVPTVLVFENKEIIKRYDGKPGRGLDISEIN